MEGRSRGYVELLADLSVVGLARAWDPGRKIAVRRRPAKFPFTNLLAAAAWAPERPRTEADLQRIPAGRRGCWYEWLVAQELWRRAAVLGEEQPEELLYWRTAEHELDHVERSGRYLEVKAGKASPVEFAWFPRTLPGARLDVITTTPFATERVRGLTMEEFLLERG